MPASENSADRAGQLHRQLSVATGPDRLTPLLELGERLFLGAPDEAQRLVTEAWEIAVEHRLEREVGRAGWMLYDIRRNAGDLVGAGAVADRLAEAAAELQSPFLETYHHYLRALTSLHGGDYESARTGFERCRRLAQRAGDRQAEASALSGLAVIAGQQGRPAEQLEMLTECRRIAEEGDVKAWRPAIAYSLAWSLAGLGRWEEAVQAFYRALAASEESGSFRLTSDAYIGLGELLLHRDRLDKAEAMFRRAADAVHKRETYAPMLRSALGGIGQVWLRQGDLAAAWQVLAEANVAGGAIEDRSDLAAITCSRAEVALGMGRLRQAQELAGEAHDVARAAGLSFHTGEALRVTGLVHAAAGRPADAAAAFERSLGLLQETSESYHLARTCFHYGRFLCDQADREAARPHLQAAVRLLRRLAMVQDAAEAIGLLLDIEQQRNPATALLEALVSLANLRLMPERFLQHALGFTCRAYGAGAGAICAGARVVATQGRPNEQRARDWSGRAELTRGPGSVSMPVWAGSAQVGNLYLEAGAESGVHHLLLESAAGMLAAALQQLPLATDSKWLPAALGLPGPVGLAVAHAARGDEPLLIRGEADTGRRLLARAVHDGGARAGRPFTVVQCVGVPDDLLADELFGHAADPAAGIVARRGRLELARSGTLVLHEFTGGPGLQARLASVAHEPAADIRVVVTTGAERADGALWELLNAELAVPPLRERRPELPELARYYMSEAAREFSRNVHEISSEAIEALAAHDWPGNLRELQHALERVVMLCAGPVIEAADLPTGLRSSRPA